ncbi:MAG: Uncharacterized protein Greene101449_1149 [Candidatus Peregrinibacteria bacterium Greene1014_49]|nr:MAG: Uncharacterized protein Greene101449_1149 [Candidatus Peregrinibacteria bacterium Greene1014_49]
MTLMITAAGAAAELVQLGKSETLGSFDADDRRIGHIDANFNDGGGNEDIETAILECPHDLFLLCGDQFAVKHGDPATGKLLG